MPWLLVPALIACPFIVAGTRLLRQWSAKRRRKRIRDAYFRARGDHTGRWRNEA